MKTKEHAAARRTFWGGVFNRGDTASPAPGRRQLEEAAARARGESSVAADGGGRGADGRRGMRKKTGEWGLIFFAVVGAVALAAWGLPRSSSFLLGGSQQ